MTSWFPIQISVSYTWFYLCFTNYMKEMRIKKYFNVRSQMTFTTSWHYQAFFFKGKITLLTTHKGSFKTGDFSLEMNMIKYHEKSRTCFTKWYLKGRLSLTRRVSQVSHLLVKLSHWPHVTKSIGFVTLGARDYGFLWPAQPPFSALLYIKIDLWGLFRLLIFGHHS